MGTQNGTSEVVYGLFCKECNGNLRFIPSWGSFLHEKEYVPGESGHFIYPGNVYAKVIDNPPIGEYTDLVRK